MTREIPLTKGFVALVDDEDYARVVAVGKWQAAVTRTSVYAAHNTRGPRTYMHRLILPGFALVDHVDGDGLNNRRSNLRGADPSRNGMNARTSRDAPTGFKGVARHRSIRNPWRAQIRVDGRQVALGAFPSADAAARAYDMAALIHFGEFARLNFPLEHSNV